MMKISNTIGIILISSAFCGCVETNPYKLFPQHTGKIAQQSKIDVAMDYVSYEGGVNGSRVIIISSSVARAQKLLKTVETELSQQNIAPGDVRLASIGAALNKSFDFVAIESPFAQYYSTKTIKDVRGNRLTSYILDKSKIRRAPFYFDPSFDSEYKKQALLKVFDKTLNSADRKGKKFEPASEMQLIGRSGSTATLFIVGYSYHANSFATSFANSFFGGLFGVYGGIEEPSTNFFLTLIDSANGEIIWRDAYGLAGNKNDAEIVEILKRIIKQMAKPK